MKKILAEVFVLALPLIVLAVHKAFSGNKITPYFIPRNLADRKYPKAELRQVGTAYCAFAAWLFLLVMTTSAYFMPTLERTPFLLALFFFIIPIVFLMALVIGMSYWFSGLFGRDAAVKPKLESMDAVQTGDLPQYIRKIRILNIINIACPFLLIVLILIEQAAGTAESGRAILLNVALLITFIMTLWRIRMYLIRAASLMDLSPNRVLASTLFSPLGIFFVWIHSFLIVRKFDRQNH